MVVLNLQFMVSHRLWRVTWLIQASLSMPTHQVSSKTPMMFDIAHEVGKNAGKDDEWGMQTFAKDTHFETSF